MYNLNEEVLLFFLLHCFTEEGLKETVHTFERESGLYFDFKYFEEVVLTGRWDEVEKYLSGFTKVEDNNHSIKIYFELRKQRYFEALDSNDQSKAIEILTKDLKVFRSRNEEVFKELTQLLTYNNIREHELLSTYQDAISSRKIVMNEIKEIIEQHPMLKGKLKFPDIDCQRLKHLLNASLNWQHQNNAPASPEHGLFMNHVNHFIPSTAAINQGTALNNLGVPSEIWTSPQLNLDRITAFVNNHNSGKNLEDLQPDLIEKSHKISESVFQICTPSQCHMLLLPKQPQENKIVRLAYTNSGNGILALTSNGNHLLWLWTHTSIDMGAKATTQVHPQLAKNGLEFMSNDLTNVNREDLVSCFAISKADSYLLSTSGGLVSLFNMVSFKTLVTFMPPPPMVTSLAFYPKDNNTFLIGLDDSSIRVYNIHKHDEVQKLEGHSKRVSALAFSNTLNILVSADASPQIIVWDSSSWEKLRERNLQIDGPNVPQMFSETHIQFHPDQQNFLFVHKIHLAIYEATELKCVNQWDSNFPTVICQATFSSNGKMVYACFLDGNLAIFDASNFQMHYNIQPSVYHLSSIPSVKIYPTVLAAHPQKPNQFAVGLTDGCVYVFEPKEPCGNWIMSQVDKEKANSIGSQGLDGLAKHILLRSL